VSIELSYRESRRLNSLMTTNKQIKSGTIVVLLSNTVATSTLRFYDKNLRYLVCVKTAVKRSFRFERCIKCIPTRKHQQNVPLHTCGINNDLKYLLGAELITQRLIST
jgi:hypothetical protein